MSEAKQTLRDRLITLRVEKLVFGGKALGYHGGMAVFVWNALPGEKIRLKITKKRKSYCEGELVEILERSPDRIEPLEPHYLSCSPWQIIEYQKEIEWKKIILKELFERNFFLNIGEFKLISGEPFGYRNKLELNFTSDQTNTLELAFYERERHIKTPIRGCILGSEVINRAALGIKDILQRNDIYPEEMKTLVLRSNRKGEVIGSLFVKRKDFPDLTSEIEKIEVLKGFKIIYSDPRYSASVVTEVLFKYGQDLLKEEILDKSFFFSDLTFFQVNPEMFERMLPDIKNFISPDDIIYDIYSGVGVIGLSIQGRYTYMVELDEESVSLAELNRRLNGVANCEVIKEKAEKYIPRIKPHSVVIFDPPRAGLSKKIIMRILKKPPKRVLYISCNPSTQARDVGMLKEKYRITFFRAYNFFPRTPHIESLIILDLKE